MFTMDLPLLCCEYEPDILLKLHSLFSLKNFRTLAPPPLEQLNRAIEDLLHLRDTSYKDPATKSKLSSFQSISNHGSCKTRKLFEQPSMVALKARPTLHFSNRRLSNNSLQNI